MYFSVLAFLLDDTLYWTILHLICLSTTYIATVKNLTSFYFYLLTGLVKTERRTLQSIPLNKL